MADQAVVRVHHLAMSYHRGGARHDVFRDISIDVQSGEIVCIVGPSGVGKTTLLRCLCGLTSPSAGSVSVAGTVVDGPPDALALVFQDYGRTLLPWLTVVDNVALPLRKTFGKAERTRRARQALGEVGLSASADAYPWQLSGGMQQRTAIARAIAYEPTALIMDEPFASVDAQSRAELEDLTMRLRDSLGVTIVIVTHDIDESVYMSDRVVVLAGSPATVNEVLEIDLPNGRDQINTKSLPEFAEYRAHVLRLIQAASGA